MILIVIRVERSMKRVFNIIVTCGRFMENNTMRELETIFYLLGDKNARFWKSPVSGIVLGYINLDPHGVINEIRKMLYEKPWEFRFSKRFIPVDLSIPTKPELIIEKAIDLSKRIPEDATYRITIEKRHSDIRSRDLIDSIALQIPNKVSLRNPDYILLIEIIGKVTGLSLIKPDEVISVEKILSSS